MTPNCSDYICVLCVLGDNETPFCLCKVKKLVSLNGTPGARVQWWESSTLGDPAQDYLKDPWHCNATNMDGMHMHKYDFLPQSDFQLQVRMVKWRKPQNFRKAMPVQGNARGVERMKIHADDYRRVKGAADQMRIHPPRAAPVAAQVTSASQASSSSS